MRYNNDVKLLDDGRAKIFDSITQSWRIIESLGHVIGPTLPEEDRQEILRHFYEHATGTAACCAQCGIYFPADFFAAQSESGSDYAIHARQDLPAIESLCHDCKSGKWNNTPDTRPIHSIDPSMDPSIFMS